MLSFLIFPLFIFTKAKVIWSSFIDTQFWFFIFNHFQKYKALEFIEIYIKEALCFVYEREAKNSFLQCWNK